MDDERYGVAPLRYGGIGYGPNGYGSSSHSTPMVPQSFIPNPKEISDLVAKHTLVNDRVLQTMIDFVNACAAMYRGRSYCLPMLMLTDGFQNSASHMWETIIRQVTYCTMPRLDRLERIYSICRIGDKEDGHWIVLEAAMARQTPQETQITDTVLPKQPSVSRVTVYNSLYSPKFLQRGIIVFDRSSGMVSGGLYRAVYVGEKLNKMKGVSATVHEDQTLALVGSFVRYLESYCMVATLADGAGKLNRNESKRTNERCNIYLQNYLRTCVLRLAKQQAATMVPSYKDRLSDLKHRKTQALEIRKNKGKGRTPQTDLPSYWFKDTAVSWLLEYRGFEETQKPGSNNCGFFCIDLIYQALARHIPLTFCDRYEARQASLGSYESNIDLDEDDDEYELHRQQQEQQQQQQQQLLPPLYSNALTGVFLQPNLYQDCHFQPHFRMDLNTPSNSPVPILFYLEYPSTQSYGLEVDWRREQGMLKGTDTDSLSLLQQQQQQQSQQQPSMIASAPTTTTAAAAAGSTSKPLIRRLHGIQLLFKKTLQMPNISDPKSDKYTVLRATDADCTKLRSKQMRYICHALLKSPGMGALILDVATDVLGLPALILQQVLCKHIIKARNGIYRGGIVINMPAPHYRSSVDRREGENDKNFPTQSALINVFIEALRVFLYGHGLDGYFNIWNFEQVQRMKSQDAHDYACVVLNILQMPKNPHPAKHFAACKEHFLLELTQSFHAEPTQRTAIQQEIQDYCTERMRATAHSLNIDNSFDDVELENFDLDLNSEPSGVKGPSYTFDDYVKHVTSTEHAEKHFFDKNVEPYNHTVRVSVGQLTMINMVYGQPGLILNGDNNQVDQEANANRTRLETVERWFNQILTNVDDTPLTRALATHTAFDRMCSPSPSIAEFFVPRNELAMLLHKRYHFASIPERMLYGN